jgi:hypothetical protein
MVVAGYIPLGPNFGGTRQPLVVCCRSPHEHNPNLQRLLYLPSATQVGLLQILLAVQLDGAKNISKFGANPLTRSKSSLPMK